MLGVKFTPAREIQTHWLVRTLTKVHSTVTTYIVLTPTRIALLALEHAHRICDKAVCSSE